MDAVQAHTLLWIAIGVVVTLAVTWALFVLLLLVFRPRRMTLNEVREFVPDITRLVRRLSTDPNVPRSARLRLLFLLFYLALPIDLVPDFIPLLGYADDVIVVGLVLRSVVRRAGRDAVDRHWTGSPMGLSLVHQLAGLD